MLKEQIEEVLREALKSQIDSCLELCGETGMNYPNLQPNGRELGYYADQILACFQDDYMDEPLTDAEHEIVKQEWEKAHAIELALKEQMERVMGVIDNKIRLLRQERLSSYDSNEMREIEASIYAVENLKSQLESE